jgi:hypothetical protein
MNEAIRKYGREFYSEAELRRYETSLWTGHEAAAIIVFGSNLAGVHGAGAAFDVMMERGFPAGLGVGFDIKARAYALPTKDQQIKTLPLDVVKLYIAQFVDFTHILDKRSLAQFKVTRVGCGLAGFSDAQIAPLFKDAASICWFDLQWIPYMPPRTKYWGTYKP